MKKECEIVKDLFPSYIAGILSEESEKFIQTHINECQECRNLLEKMSENSENSKLESEDKIEYNHLKKYRKKMVILKSVLFSIVIVIIAIVAIFITKYNYNNNIMEQVISKIEESKKSDNYSIKKVEHRIDYERNNEFTFTKVYYYKDGKYKEESLAESPNQKFLNSTMYEYGEINSNQKIEITEDTKTANIETSNYTYVKEGQFFNLLLNEVQLYNTNFGFFSDIFMRMGYQVRTDRYNGKECYVFKIEDDTSYTEKWIDKESMMIVRAIQDVYNKSYTEISYFVSFDDVTEEQVAVPNLQDYNVENSEKSMEEEMVEIYNKNL